MDAPSTVPPSSAPPPNSDVPLLVEALKLNWEHARHVEKQRNALVLAYVGAMLAAGALALEKDKPGLVVGACIAGLFVTALCWGMTHKWNLAFATQIQKADLCARALRIGHPESGDLPSHELHAFIGFPRRDPWLPWLNNRLLLNVLYAVTTLFWLSFVASRLVLQP